VPLLGVPLEGRHVVLAFLEIAERAEVDLLGLLLHEAGDQRGGGDGQGDDRADQRAEPERRALEELAARKALAGLGLRRRRSTVRGGDLPVARRDGGLPPGRDLAHPEEAEDEREAGADRGDVPADDQPDE
jgi:hypothetical protein